MAMFSPWVALEVSTTRAGSRTQKRSASASRQSSTVSAASMALSYAPLPGLAMVRMASAAA